MDNSNETEIKKKRRQHLVNIAKAKFYESSIANTTMHEISTEANIGRSTMYEYFSSKSELLSYIRTSYINDIYDVQLDLDDSLNGMQQLQIILESYFEVMLDRPKTMLFLSEYIRYLKDQDGAVDDLPLKNYETHNKLKEAIILGQKDGSLKHPEMNRRIAMIMETLIATATRFAVKEQYTYASRNISIHKDEMMTLIKILLNGIMTP